MSHRDRFRVVGNAAREPRLQLDAQKLLFELTDAAVVVELPSLVIRAANPCCERATGYCVDDLIGASLELLVPQQPAGRVEPTSGAELVRQPGLHDEVAIRRLDGSCFIASVHVTTTADQGQETAVLFIRDISERRKLERELITKHLALKDAYEQLERTNAQLAVANAEIRSAQRCLLQMEKMATVGRFAAGVAHEVNNPMAFVMENLAHLQEYSAHILPVLRSHLDGPGPYAASEEHLREIVAELQPMLDESFDGTQRVSSIVRQLHSFSHVTDQEAEWVDLREVVESSIMMVKNQIRQRARLERHFYEIPKVACVAGQIGQVVINLLINSVHAIEEEASERNFILVVTKPLGDAVIIQVRDTGCGIPPENIQRITEPFFTTKPAGVGSGLGLAISASIVESHGGRIEVESQVGKGTMMRVVLPVEGKLSPPRPAAVVSEATVSARRLKLLLVDDEAFLLRALKRTLGQAHEVLLAAGPQQALETLAGTEVDLIIADLMMPEMNGIALYEKIVETRPQLRRRFAIMTGGVCDEQVRVALAGSGRAVLPKPFKREELDRIIAGIPPRDATGGRLP